MMREVPVLTFTDPDGAYRRIARTAEERRLVEWLRAAARDRTPDAVRGGPYWYLVAVRPGREAETAIRLLRDRVKAFCPREKVVEKNPSGRGTRVVRRPMYPGYIFVELAPGEPCWAGVLTYEGVLRLVPESDRPSRMSAAAMAEIRRIARARAHRKRKAPTLFVIGETVLIKEGPFAHFEGKVVRADEARGRLVVEAEIFGQEVPVHLGLDQVAKLR